MGPKNLNLILLIALIVVIATPIAPMPASGQSNNTDQTSNRQSGSAEQFNVPMFTVTPLADGGEPQVFTFTGGLIRSGLVTGLAFEGDASGLTGNFDAAFDTCMIVESPDGTTVSFGGAAVEVPGFPECGTANAIPWDFLEGQSGNDGFYQSLQLDAFAGGVDIEGTWTISFVHGWPSFAASPITWGNVAITLLGPGQFKLPRFTLTSLISGGTAKLFSFPHSISEPVTGLSFEGDVSGVTGNPTRAADTCLIVEAPDGTTVAFGGLFSDLPGFPLCNLNNSASSPWDFLGVISGTDGFYQSLHPSVFAAGVETDGPWKFTLVNAWNSTSSRPITWENVIISLIGDRLFSDRFVSDR